MYEFLRLIPHFDWLIESPWNLHVIKYFRESPCGTRYFGTEEQQIQWFTSVKEQWAPDWGDAFERRHLLRIFGIARNAGSDKNLAPKIQNVWNFHYWKWFSFDADMQEVRGTCV